MKYTITLRDTVTKDQTDYKSDYDYTDNPGYPPHSAVTYQWLEGNHSCDCNRSQFLWDDEDKELTCNDEYNRIEILKIVDEDDNLVWGEDTQLVFERITDLKFLHGNGQKPIGALSNE